MNNRLQNCVGVIIAVLGALLLCAVPSAAYADGDDEGPYRQRSDAHGSSVETIAQLLTIVQDPVLNGPNNINATDDKNRLTADVETNPESANLAAWARCASVAIGKAPNSPSVSDETSTDNCTLPEDSDTETVEPGRLPTTREILLAASTLIHADGAGLHKRPTRTSYTNKYVPTLVAATHPTQTHVINLLGHDITITLTATNYEWDWGDGTPHTAVS